MPQGARHRPYKLHSGWFERAAAWPLHRAGRSSAGSSSVPALLPWLSHCGWCVCSKPFGMLLFMGCSWVGQWHQRSNLSRYDFGSLTVVCWTVFEPVWQRAPRWAFRLATNSGCPDNRSETKLALMQDFAGHAAANDTNYLPPRHRTLPILASITPIARYPSKLRIFLTHASRY